jgi:hypothetical protein
MTPRDLVVQWRTDADLLQRYHDARAAAIVRQHADALETALREEDDDVLSLSDAAKESGFSKERLRHRVAAGEIPNAGRKGAPLIRRRDLPRKPRGASTAFDAEAIADEIASRRRHG